MYCAYVRTPGPDSSTVEITHLNSPLGLDLGDTSAYLGVPPPDVPTLHDVASGVREPNAPFSLIPQSDPVAGPSDEEVKLATLRKVPTPTAATMEQFLLSGEVPGPTRLSEPRIREIITVTVLDVPGADVFVKRGDGTLRTPAEQLAYFNSLQPKPTLDRLKLYANSRGLELGLN